jgi:predicted small secreted protein
MDRKTIRAKPVAVAAALLTTACSTVGVRSGAGEPAFTGVARIGDIQIRTFGQRLGQPG